MSEFTHIDQNGKAVMVDISDKKIQKREAIACGEITLTPSTIDLILNNSMKKGDVLTVARIAGIQAVKATSGMIPLCHPLLFTNIVLTAEITDLGVIASCTVGCTGQTGAEMEALTGVSVALLTVYDMCKAVDKTMEIGKIKLISKTKQDIS
jgi:cyclic pyranopterin phosphate synthase